MKSTKNVFEIYCKSTLNQLTEKNLKCAKNLNTKIHHVSDVRKKIK